MTTVSTVTLLEALRGRRAVRSYDPRVLEPDEIRALLDAAVRAPSAMNAQPWAFAIVQDPARLKRWSDRAKAALLASGAADPKLHRYADILRDPSFNIFYDARTLIVICGPAEGQYAQADCWLAAENLMLAAYAMGLGTCCIGFAQLVLQEPEVRAELGIPADMKAYAPILVGVPSGPMPEVPRNAPRILSWT